MPRSNRKGRSPGNRSWGASFTLQPDETGTMQLVPAPVTDHTPTTTAQNDDQEDNDDE